MFEWVKKLSFKPKIFQYTNDTNQPSTSTGLNKLNPVSLSNYIFSTDCILCGKKRPNLKINDSVQKLCDSCQNLDQIAFAKLQINFQKSEKKMIGLIKICQICTGNNNHNIGLKNECISMDCPNNFFLLNSKQEYQKTDYVRKIIHDFF